MGDETRINQILINLLSNAMKFTPEEGRINVYLTQEELPEETGRVRCHFRVKDNGIGMTDEFQKKILNHFPGKTRCGYRRRKEPVLVWR